MCLSDVNIPMIVEWSKWCELEKAVQKVKWCKLVPDFEELQKQVISLHSMWSESQWRVVSIKSEMLELWGALTTEKAVASGTHCKVESWENRISKRKGKEGNKVCHKLSETFNDKFNFLMLYYKIFITLQELQNL